MNVLIIFSHKLISSFLMIFSALRNSLSLSLSRSPRLGYFSQLDFVKKSFALAEKSQRQASDTYHPIRIRRLADQKSKKAYLELLSLHRHYAYLTGCFCV